MSYPVSIVSFVFILRRSPAGGQGRTGHHRECERKRLRCTRYLTRSRSTPYAIADHTGTCSIPVIQRLIQCELDNPRYACLSTSYTSTTVGGAENLDEVIHLTSAIILFVRFRSVIGMMWGSDSDHAGKIPLVFYEHMVDKEGSLDHTRVAFALHESARNKLTGVPLEHRILYVHLGAFKVSVLKTNIPTVAPSDDPRRRYLSSSAYERHSALEVSLHAKVKRFSFQSHGSHQTGRT